MFNFLRQAILTLNEPATAAHGFHLIFMLQLCEYLGFGIKSVHEIDQQLQQSGYQWGLQPAALEQLNGLIQSMPLSQVTIDKATRRQMLAGLLRFYQLHVDHLDTLRSWRVFQEIS